MDMGSSTTGAMGSMSHDMGSMSHTMSMGMPAQTSGSMSMDHSGMDHSGHNMSGMGDMGGMGSMGGMDHGGGSGCKISMLFNTNTIDACFLSDRWRIRSQGMFAGSCIGVFFFGMMLEFLRRSVKEYDRYLIKQHIANYSRPGEASSLSSKDGVRNDNCNSIPPFRPNAWQQGIRAILHLLQFVCAYFLMLLAMYYNGYILLCIFLGVLFGAYIFQWEFLMSGGQTSAASEATVCCG